MGKLVFNVVDGEYDDSFEEWVEEYNKSTPVADIQRKLGISQYIHRKYWRRGLAEGLIVDRKQKKKGKYYYKTEYGYEVVKRDADTGEKVYYGSFKTEKEAKDYVEYLKSVDWRVE